MTGTPFSDNLTFACSLFPSIAEVCRRIAINRQQFNKYLSGDVRPSRHNMRRIYDFFGVTESELLGDPQRFAELISLRGSPVPDPRMPPWAHPVERLHRASTGLDRYVGWYFRYFYSFGYPGKITRSLSVISRKDDRFYWKNIEFSPEDPLGGPRKTGKYEGMVFLLEDRIHVIEHESLMCSSITQLMLYPAYQTGVGYLLGLQTGGSMKRGRRPAASVVLLEYLGGRVDLRRALKRCGRFDEAEIDAPLRRMIQNEITPGNYVFDVEQL